MIPFRATQQFFHRRREQAIEVRLTAGNHRHCA